MGKDPIYEQYAVELGEAMAQRNHGLVYGGASIGLMGAIADTLLKHQQPVVGVIPETLVRYEVAHDDLTELIITDTMHERKAAMAELSDAFLALPGGFGTLEEVFETITWAQLSIHAKPMILLNVNGYFDQLNEFVQHANDQGFIRSDNQSLFHIESNIQTALDRLEVQAAHRATDGQYEKS
jgi:uncharacterized protein (TIGR00730 family)